VKTRAFLAELAKYGWCVGREGNKHVILENQLITVDRPIGLRRQDIRDIDPIVVSIQCKAAGLIWDQGRQCAKLNPAHPYYSRYQAALGLNQRAA
jgi:hypothetical protein